MDSDTLDLDRAQRAVSTLVNNEQQVYQPRTLTAHSRARSVYLPMYPTLAFGPNNHLLLPHVPVIRLAPHEIALRQQGAYTADAMTLLKNYHYSDRDGFSLSEQDAEELAARLQVGLSIITFNADRLRGFSHYLLALHESYRRKVLGWRDVALKESTLNSKQTAIALEFFLQMDVDVFYMRSCSFRRAAQSESNMSETAAASGLFCEKDEPQGRYTMVPCGNRFCSCCHPVNRAKKSQPWPVVDFGSSAVHQFANGYTTYLNCPATCHTTNVIYSMTCPCGHYDYVDSTANTLSDTMAYHREHGNRIIHEKLTGIRLSRGTTIDPVTQENDMADKMRLYQHSARCPVALRSFLDCNPIYWCFIPMLWHEANTENIADLQAHTSCSCSSSSANAAATADPELTNIIAMGAIDNPRVAYYLQNIFLPPARYAFSYRQRQKQRLFFEQFTSFSNPRGAYSALDLYKVKIIAVLPDDRSIILRYIIETLFIIHSETKLNMICPIGGDPEQRYGRPYNLVWCADLNHRSIESSITSIQ